MNFRLTPPPQATNEDIVQGVVQKITFRNEENGFVILQVKTDDSIEPLTVTGTSFSVQTGTSIVARGLFKNHPKYGKQLTAITITETLPKTAKGIERYLGSGLIKGIGKESAKRIIEELGENALEIIHQDPNRIANIPGIGRHKAKLIAAAFYQQRDLDEIIQFLVMNGLSANLAGKIYEKYQNKSIEVLKRNPYILAKEMRGIGFIKADEIAKNMGVDQRAPERLQAGLLYVLEKAEDDGHCFLPKLLLLDNAYELLKVSNDTDLESQLKVLKSEESIIEDEDTYGESLIYLPSLYRAEKIVANFVQTRTKKLDKAILSEEQAQTAISKAQDELNLEFSNEQIHAVKTALNYRLMIITGGPGCGKTTLTRALVQMFRGSKKKLLLAAPTGRASQRMSQVCDMESKTIHRLLRFDPISGRFQHDLSEQLDADAIIVDESSMIDIRLAASLFQAIKPNCSLILVGDKDQLPSVGPGRLLADLVSLPSVQTVTLSQLFRRGEESTINTVAHAINMGRVPNIPQPDGVTKVDAYFIRKDDAESCAAMVEKLVTEQIPKKFGFKQDDILVLTPSNRGALGTVMLNERIREKLNPKKEGEREINDHGLKFRVGDRVCQRSNNYQLGETGVFNGDFGKVEEINVKDKSLVVDLWDGRLVKYASGEISQLNLAYAITVHRSQGSEIPCVVLVLHDSHFIMLERQLVYTGITRAKKLLIVVGTQKALYIASKRASSKERFTGVVRRIEN